MTRDLRRLADTPFDVLVIGSGFYGAVAAWDATLRGLSVALIDMHDFGAGTSFNNLKTLHGGLRSLQAMNLAQMRLFIRERRALARVAPHLVRPMPFVVPTERPPMRSAALMRLALRINDLVAHDRHRGIHDPSRHLPPGRVVSRDECLRLNPLIDPAGVTGGAIWYDYQMHNTDRMTLAFVLSAARAGAATANYVEAIGLLRDGERVVGARVRDRFTTEEFAVRARAVVNAAGPWAASLLGAAGLATSTPAPRLSRAMNLVTRPLPIGQGCGGRARGRFLFMVPWREVTLIGTSHDAHEGGPGRLSVSAADLLAFLDEVNEAFPRARLTPHDIRLVHRGLLPMVAGRGNHVRLLRESAVVDHARDRAPGLVSMFGVRYTTARHTAARAVDAVLRALGERRPAPSRTAEVPVAGGDIADVPRLLQNVERLDAPPTSADMRRRLVMTYGSGYDAILRLVASDPDLAEPLGTSCAVTGAEIVHAVRTESAVTLADALVRRTEAGSAGHPGADAVSRAAALLARELRWNASRTDREITELESFYHLPA